jgi:hypothetical protein
MDDTNLKNRRNDVLEKLKKEFKLSQEEAKKIVKSIELYCEIILHGMNKK